MNIKNKVSQSLMIALLVLFEIPAISQKKSVISINNKINKLIGEMTVEEKVGQMNQLTLSFLEGQ